MRRPEIASDVTLEEEIEHLIAEAQENGVPDSEIRDVLERQKRIRDDFQDPLDVIEESQ